MCKGHLILISVLATCCIFVCLKYTNTVVNTTPLLRSLEAWHELQNSKLQSQMRDAGFCN